MAQSKFFKPPEDQYGLGLTDPTIDPVTGLHITTPSDIGNVPTSTSQVPLTMQQNPIPTSSNIPVQSDQNVSEQMKKQALQDYIDRWQKAKSTPQPDNADLRQGQMIRGMQAGLENAANTMSNFVKPGMKFDSSEQRNLAEQADQEKLKQETDRYNVIKQQGEDAFSKAPALAESIANLPLERQEKTVAGAIQSEQLKTLEDAEAKRQTEKATLQDMNNPNSEVSKAYRNLYSKLSKGQNVPDTVSATQLAQILPIIKDTYNAEQARLNRMDILNYQQGNQQQNKQVSIIEARRTIIGKDIEKTKEEYVKAKQGVDQTQQLIDSGLKGQPIAASAGMRALAMQFNKGALSENDVAAFKGSAALKDKFSRLLNKSFVTGAELTPKDLQDLSEISKIQSQLTEQSYQTNIDRHKQSLKRDLGESTVKEFFPEEGKIYEERTGTTTKAVAPSATKKRIPPSGEGL